MNISILHHDIAKCNEFFLASADSRVERGEEYRRGRVASDKERRNAEAQGRERGGARAGEQGSRGAGEAESNCNENTKTGGYDSENPLSENRSAARLWLSKVMVRNGLRCAGEVKMAAGVFGVFGIAFRKRFDLNGAQPARQVAMLPAAYVRRGAAGRRCRHPLLLECGNW